MRPLVVLLGIVMGSTVSIAAALLLTGVVFLLLAVLLPEHGARLAEDRQPLMVACLLSVLLAGVAATSFYGELRVRAWRYAAHGALLVVLAVALWTYWPKS